MKKPSVFGRAFNLLVYIFLYAPIIVLIIFSFNASKSRTIWAGFTLDWYIKLFSDDTVLKAFGVTVAVAVIASVIATVIGTMAAIGFFSMRRKSRSLFMNINNIPMTNADIITGVSLMLLFVFSTQALNAFVALIIPESGIEFQLGFGTLLISHITFDVPYVILSVMPCLYHLDKNLSEAAQDLGATPSQAFFKIILPQLRPGVVNGLIIAFTMSIDDFVISYFTAGSSVSTLAMVIYSMTRKRISPEINAISTILFVSVLVLLIVINAREIHQQNAEQKRLTALKRDAAAH
ncbi:MAG: ABC transporter permease [Oscillospiraceae bacterium]|nr:ABC transporter permease [Oscillospiraceae bacterium]